MVKEKQDALPTALNHIEHEEDKKPLQIRVGFVYTVINSINAPVAEVVAVPEEIELEKRVQEIKKGKVRGILAQEVFAKLAKNTTEQINYLIDLGDESAFAKSSGIGSFKRW